MIIKINKIIINILEKLKDSEGNPSKVSAELAINSLVTFPVVLKEKFKLPIAKK